MKIEFFGIPRARAGVAQTTAAGANLGEVLADLAARYPALAESCIDESRLQSGCVANLAGERFVRDPATPLIDGQTVLILSADVGG